MKKNFDKLIIIVALIVLITACKKDTNITIIGKWTYSKYVTLTSKTNGTKISDTVYQHAGCSLEFRNDGKLISTNWDNPTNKFVVDTLNYMLAGNYVIMNLNDSMEILTLDSHNLIQKSKLDTDMLPDTVVYLTYFTK